MLRVSGIRILVVLSALLGALGPVRLIAQDDPNEVPLGDVARSLRKNQTATPQVIDDDNLTQVIEQADKHDGFGSSLRYVMAGKSSRFQVSAPDVTCSLAFTANVKSLLSSTQYAEMDLSPSDVAKLEGPAAIEGDSLTISLFNATNWHVSEIDVALTVVKKSWGRDASPFSNLESGTDPGAGAAAGVNPFEQVRPEKKQDTTVIYRMRAAAPPWSRAGFSAPLRIDLAPGDEWHWAIVQAKGYPPQGDSGQQQTAAQTAASATLQPVSSPVATDPQDQPGSPTLHDPE
jgi:hypothetical protein